MEKINEIRIAGLNLVDVTIRLQYNVNNGCYSDKAQLEINMARLNNFAKWVIENNQTIAVRHYFASANFGQPFQFIANDISNLF